MYLHKKRTKLLLFSGIRKKNPYFEQKYLHRFAFLAINHYLCNLKLDTRHLKPTISYIESKFEEYNRLYFNGSLPPVPVRLSNAKGFLGKLCFRKQRHGLFGRVHNTDFVLRINTRIDLPEDLVEDTILHEMIHYYIAVNQWNDTSAHGTLFRREMARINATGRHISVSHRLTPEQATQAAGREKKRPVAVVYFEDGRVGVKVVPKQVAHILRFHRAALAHFPVARIDWYLTAAPLFAQYPSSAALRIYLVQDMAALDEALKNSHRMSCDGKQLRLTKGTAW